MIEISVIISTYNRSDIIEECVRRLQKNDFDQKKFEILIIDDGSTDTTPEILKELKKEYENLVVITQKNSGQAKGRNLGIDKASGKIILFINDDILTEKNFLKEHLNIHETNPEKNFACLGLTEWDPNIKINSLMKWSTNEKTIFGKFGGHQFAYPKLEKGNQLNYNFFYTSNISLKKEILIENKFNTEFNAYGWEDIELGYRLETKNNLKIIYNPKALAYHHHEINLNDLKKRMISIGIGLQKFIKLHPEIKEKPSKTKIMLFKIITNSLFISIYKIISIASFKKLEPIYYYALSKKYFLIGFQS